MVSPVTTRFVKDTHNLQATLEKQAALSQGTASLGQAREVILLILGMPERLMMTQSSMYTLGRFDKKSILNDRVDLSPYDAAHRGVSRQHACLYMEDNHLYLIDLGSSNGTFLGGQRLSPHQPALLRKGDEILLGRLPVQFLFR